MCPQNRMNRNEQKFTSAFAEVLQENPWCEAQRQDESRRMYHDRIAQKFARAVARKLKKTDVIGWAVYGGDDKWSYAVRAGKHVLMIEKNSVDEDPATV